MTLLNFISNPDLPIYDPTKYRLPKELERQPHKPFKVHPSEAMEKTYDEIFTYNKTRTDEELRNVKTFFEKHPRQFKQSKISLSQIME